LNTGVPRAKWWRLLARIARVLGLAVLVAASLVTFPNALAWMIAFWLAWATVWLVRGGRGWAAFAVCGAVVLVKCVPWTPGVAQLASIAGVVVVARVIAARGGSDRQTRLIGLASAIALWLAWVMMLLDWRAAARCSRAPTLKRGRPIVCLGNSMTSMGRPAGGYPEVLAEVVAVPVVNLGQPGLTARQALRLLPDLDKAEPQVVVVELGGNDYLQGRTLAAVKADLETILAACERIGAQVVLMEIPRHYVWDFYWGLERELAREHDIELVPDTAIRRLLLASPTMPPGQWTHVPFLTQSDGLHPNQRGNRLLAEYVLAALGRMYGPAILQAP